MKESSPSTKTLNNTEKKIEEKTSTSLNKEQNPETKRTITLPPKPYTNLLGKKFKKIRELFPVLLPAFHDSILSVGHKGKFTLTKHT